EERTEKRLALLKEQIIQRKQAEEALRHESSRLRLLQEVAVAANEAHSIEELLQFALDKICQYMAWPAGQIYLRAETNSGELVSAGLWHCADDRFTFLQEVAAHEAWQQANRSWLKQVVEQRRPAWWDFNQDFLTPALFEQKPDIDIKSHFVLPVVVGDEVVALLEFFAREATELADEILSVMEHIALQLGRVVERNQAQEAILRTKHWLRHLAGWVVNAQEEERQRVSRELHDEAGQALTALKISLELMGESLPAELTAVHTSLDDAIILTDQTMESIRLLAHNLRPPVLDRFGLDASLEGLCRDFADRIQLPIRYQGAELPSLPDATATTLYRFVQEALTNAAKHANASRIEVTLSHDPDKISLLVADDGQGFQVDRSWPWLDTNTIPQINGMGLRGMVERLMLLGGQLDIDSTPDQGTRLTAVIPYHTIQEA
ncbi:MAG: GAF domain-containing sensor histidine kinase, partial [Chloroflexota bacterium]